MGINNGKWGALNGYKPFASVARPAIPECHKGNIKILDWGNGAGLYAGGWTRQADPGDGWAVINLSDWRTPARYTGDIEAVGLFGNILKGDGNPYKAITLYMPIRDFDTPAWGQDTWINLALDVQGILEKGINVLVACDGGHGRTGMVVAILATMLCKDNRTLPDPVAWIRKVYCINAIETIRQEWYVYNTLGIEPPHTLSTPKAGAWQKALPFVDPIGEEWSEETEAMYQETDEEYWRVDNCSTCGELQPLNDYDVCKVCMKDLYTS